MMNGISDDTPFSFHRNVPKRFVRVRRDKFLGREERVISNRFSDYATIANPHTARLLGIPQAQPVLRMRQVKRSDGPEVGFEDSKPVSGQCPDSRQARNSPDFFAIFACSKSASCRSSLQPCSLSSLPLQPRHSDVNCGRLSQWENG